LSLREQQQHTILNFAVRNSSCGKNKNKEKLKTKFNCFDPIEKIFWEVIFDFPIKYAWMWKVFSGI
jgi:hypothetical protein